MHKVILEIECIRAGQPRPYADEVYEAIYTFSASRGEWTPDREHVLPFIKADYGKDFRVDTPDKYPLAYLKALDKLAANKWRVVIVYPFLD